MPCPLSLAPRKCIEQKPNNLFLLFLRLSAQLQEKEVNHIKHEPTFELPESPGAIIIARVSSLQRFSEDAASSSSPILARPGQTRPRQN
jgi:hypothetical protein